MSRVKRARERYIAEVNRVTKWRALFAGWQLGTRPNDDPEVQAVRDQRELLILLRAELSGLVGLLVKKQVFDEAEWLEQLTEELTELDKAYMKRWPGVKATPTGLHFNTAVMQEHEWMKGWKP